MVNAKYGVVETSRVNATYPGGGHIYSMVDDAADMENGMIVTLGDPVETSGNEEYKAVTPVKGSQIILIANPALIYDQSTTVGQAEYNYVIEAGKGARAYSIIPHDMYAVSENLITKITGDKVTKGNLVVAKDRKYQEITKATAVTDYGFVAKIRYTYTKSGVTMVMLEVLKNTEVATA